MRKFQHEICASRDDKARLYSRVARGAKQAEEAPPYPRLMVFQQKPTRSMYHFF